MAAEQLKQRGDTAMVEKQGVPQLRSHFEGIVETEKKSTKETKGSETGEDSEQAKGTKGCCPQNQSAETVKETLTSAAKTTKDYAAPMAEKAKGYTAQKAVAAKDAAVGGGKVAAEYAGKAAEAGWSTAHYTCETAVEGTKAAGRLVKGAAESMKEYTARKKEEAEREAMYKKCMNEEKKEAFGGEEGKEQYQSATTKEHIA